MTILEKTSPCRQHAGYTIRPATETDLTGARSVMLDTFYRVFDYGYLPAVHDDVIELAGTYLNTLDHLLLVAVVDDEIVATTAVRSQGPRCPPHPRWLVERYPDATTAQLFRVYVRPEHRRRGLATAMVTDAVHVVAGNSRFESLYLHTDTRTPGALEFWQTFGAIVHDGRHPGEGFQTVHLEIPLARPGSSS